jgi:sugar/nucleoside kinase (ribokinase family)
MPPEGTAELVRGIDLKTGGCGCNTALVLHKLGQPVGLLGKVGCDHFGDFLLRTLAQAGLETGDVVRDCRTRTSSVIVLVSAGGERSFLYCPGGNEDLTLADVHRQSIAQARMVHVGGIMKLLRLEAAELLRLAKGMGKTTSLDTDWDPSGRWLAAIEPCLAHTDLFLPSLDEARRMSGLQQPADIAAFFLDRGPTVVVLKMGADGCYVRTGREGFRLPACRVKVVDTTGAGDAFVAGFLAGRRMEWDLEACGRLGNACGALCVTAMGTTDGIVNLEKTKSFMESASPPA